MPKQSEKTKLLRANKAKIDALVAQGKSLREIGKLFGCSHVSILNALKLDEKAKVSRYVSSARRNRKKNDETVGISPSQYIGQIERIVVRGELPPPDTRDLTGRIFGDPLPGRSYLDRMRQKEGA